MKAVILVFSFLFSIVPALEAIQPDGSESRKIELAAPAGAPLRLYLTKRVSRRAGQPVEGKTIEPVFAFDREVVPAGSLVSGRISRAPSVSKWRRVQSILNGDFTPLRSAVIQIDTLTLPDGTKRSIRTGEAPALSTFFNEPSTKKQKQKAQQQKPQPGPQDQDGGILGTAKQRAKQTLKQKMDSEIRSRTYGVADIVRAPNHREKLIDFLWARSPYHPQYLRRGTRVDSPLIDPLQFGSAEIKTKDLAAIGSQPAADAMGRVRLLTPLDSATAKIGDPVRASVSIPLFTADRKLALPEGTMLTGTVTVAKKAGSFHRGGQLRFRFDNLVLSQEATSEAPALAAEVASSAPANSQDETQAELKRRATPLSTEATLEGAESGGGTPIKIDSEGGVQTQESKSRFLAPAISLIIASRAADNDAGRNHAASGAGGEANVSGRTLGGLSGFGLVGAVSSQGSKYIGMAFGYYGLALSVYSNVVAKGGEIIFNQNAMMDVRFGARSAATRQKKP
jgi:hypothetical protein